MCLLSVLSMLREKEKISLCAVHVNYGLRGRDALRDEVAVRALAKELSVPIVVKNMKRDSHKKYAEEFLRDFRYAFFEKARKEKKYDYVAVAHTRDDQAETVLLHLLRGAGLQGLRGMLWKRGRIIRPFLDVSRSDVEKYNREHKIPSFQDITNTDIRFTRNKIRHKLIPYIEKNFNPSFRNVAARLAQGIAEDYDFLLLQKKERIFLKREGAILFSVRKFHLLHPALQRMYLRGAMANLCGTSVNFTAGHIEEVQKALQSTKSKMQKVTLRGLKVERRGDRVTLLRLKNSKESSKQ